MSTEIPAQALLAVATVVASLITGMIAFVNLTLSKEQKVSEFRQAWIDGLRDDLAKVSSVLRFLAEAAHASAFYSQEMSNQVLPRTPQQLAELRTLAAESLSRIALRLNPEEQDHIELLRLLHRARQCTNAINVTNPSNIEAFQAIDVAVEFARPVLKAEWKRVKTGEPVFRVARAWVVQVILALSLVLGAFIAFGKFHY